MGRYQDDRYYKGSGDGDLQWLEDGIGLIFGIAWYSIVLFITGVIGILSGLFCLITGTDSDR